MDGDLGRPNVFVPLTAEDVERKLELLERHFANAVRQALVRRETFRGLMRLRGMEAIAAERYAEGFSGRKVSLAP